MTKLIRLTLLTCLTFLFQFSQGQSELYSTWTVSCPMEKTNAASGKISGICPMSEDNSGIKISEFEMIIDKDEIKFSMDESKSGVKYKWDDELNAIEFKRKNNTYKFKVLLSSNENFIVLKSTDDLILTLVKKH